MVSSLTRFFWRGLGVALLLCLGVMNTVGAESLRCGNGLVSTGDPAIDVRHECGPPSFVDPWIGGSGGAYGPGPGMEEWTYNRGPGQLLQIVVFRNGIVEGFKTAGYGFVPRPLSRGCQAGDIQTGMSKYRLLYLCGPPDQQNGLFVYSSHFSSAGRDYYLGRGVFPVYREHWIYNFGSRRLERDVTLENAVVVDIQTLRRGFDH